MSFIRSVLAWAKRNERHISTLVYIAGFVSDLFTFILIPISVANLLFLSYLGLVAACVLGSYFLHAYGYTQRSGLIWRALNVLLPLGAQYFIGNLLSGFLIFYTKSAVVFASWPFLLVLAVIFIGNEFFRDYRNYLAFQISLFFFALYAYLIFAIPLVMHGLGSAYFLGSTVVSLGIIIVFLGVLALINKRDLLSSWWQIGIGIAAVTVVVTGSYFTGLIPPIPLTLTDSGIYHSLAKTSRGYEFQAEDTNTNAWWQVGPFQNTVLHGINGTLTAYSAVFAPTRFGTSVVHRWEYYDPISHDWKLKAQVTFPINGGRNGGYRGYSTVSNLQSGKYRVSIETLSGQVIGRIPFTFEKASTTPTLHTEIK